MIVPLEITATLQTFGAKKIFLFPDDMTYMSLDLALQDMFAWSGFKKHRFVFGDSVICDGKDGSKDELDTFVDGNARNGEYIIGDFVIGLDIKKIDGEDIKAPIVTGGQGLFPTEHHTSEEWFEFLMCPDAYPAERAELEEAQDIDSVNKYFQDWWKPVPVLKGRVSVVNSQIIGQILFQGISGFYYDPVLEEIVPKEIATKDDLPIDSKDSAIVCALIEQFSTCHDVDKENQLQSICDRYPDEWTEFTIEHSQAAIEAWAFGNSLYSEIVQEDSDITDIVQKVGAFFTSSNEDSDE